MKKIPKLQRAKRGKKYIGSYFVMVDGERVNLDTKNATLALERAKDAAKGTRNFQADHDAAADTTEETLTAQNPPPPAPPPAAPAPLALAPLPAQPEAPAAPPPVVDPPQAPAGDWAADTQAAAQETKEQTDSADPDAATAPGVTVQIDPNVLEQMYKVLAEFTVEAQLMLQAKAVTWKTGTKPPPLDAFFEAHPKAPDMMVNGVKTSKELAVTCWTQFFRRKFPVNNIPDWAGAMILTGGLVSVQYVAAKVTEEEKRRGANARPTTDGPVGADPDHPHGHDNGAAAEAL